MKITFKEKSFFVIQGSVHPAYSIATFTEEELEFREKYWNIQPGEIVFDVGSSYGAYSLTATALGAQVYCFEPEPGVFSDLVRNIKLNNWSKKCLAFNMGLWNKPAIIDMKSYAPHWPAQSISGDYTMDSLDNFIKNKEINKIDWLKIDVEGAEEKVLEGAQNLLKEFHPKLIIECHNFLDPEISLRIKEGLTNYTFEEIKRDPCVILASK